MKKLKIGFFGSPEISATLLKALLAHNDFEVVLVVSNPDRARGRSGRPQPTAVSQTAIDSGIPLHRFEGLKDPSITSQLAEKGADVFVVFAYGYFLPSSIYEMPPHKTINLHASLLPHLRGASPVQSAILAGDTETGWSLQYVTAKMDAGPILAEMKFPILPEENAGALLERMLPAGIDLLIRSLQDLNELAPGARAQDESLADFCSKFTTEMAYLSWENDATDIANFVRALHPGPMARTTLEGAVIKICKVREIKRENDLYATLEKDLLASAKGSLWALKLDGISRLYAKAGQGYLEILELQKAGKKRMTARDFLNGNRLSNDARFE